MPKYRSQNRRFMEQDSKLAQHQTIDIGQVVAKKFKKQLPRFVVRALEKLIRQDEINDFLMKYGHLDGVNFAHQLVNRFQIKLDLLHEDRLPNNPRALFICNHPLGAMDGICLASIISKHYGTSVRYIVNDMLLFLKPLRDIFVPVNTLSGQSRESVLKINEALATDFPVLTFPAGMCSRKINGEITDLPWKKSFVNQAIRSRRDIVPLYFHGYNSSFFYNIEKFRKAIGINFNIGTALLPREMFATQDKHFTIVVGDPVSYQQLKESNQSADELAQLLRNKVYNLRYEVTNVTI